MQKNRLEAFTDAIVPIIMTVLVLELGMPKTSTWQGFWAMREQFLAYTISFFLLAIVWGNHHHMFQLVQTINGLVIWANTILLFFLSFVPFATEIVNDDPNSLFGSQLYTLLFICINLAWNFLRVSLLRANRHHQVLVAALAHEPKSLITLAAFVVVFLLTFVWHEFGMIGTFLVMMLWIMPYKRIEEAMKRL
jgi:uncharacterized membrane protein